VYIFGTPVDRCLYFKVYWWLSNIRNYCCPKWILSCKSIDLVDLVNFMFRA
jgi:hypothetical protein